MIKTRYVLVSQGIKIYATYNKEQAVAMVDKANESWRKYVQKCLDDHEPYADNEIFMYEEEVEEEDMTDVRFQEHLKELYDKHLGRFKAEHTTLNELLYVLRMDDNDWQVNTYDTKTKNGCTCIPGVRDTFVPVRLLAQKVVAVEFDEETYEEDGIKLLLVNVED